RVADDDAGNVACGFYQGVFRSVVGFNQLESSLGKDLALGLEIVEDVVGDPYPYRASLLCYCHLKAPSPSETDAVKSSLSLVKLRNRKFHKIDGLFAVSVRSGHRMGKKVLGFDEGSKEMRDLLGGKGANIAEMIQVLG